MNTKAEQNSQKGTTNVHSNNYSKQESGKLMDLNILSNMKTHIKKTHQASRNGMPMPIPVKSKLEPEYLNNILIDINEKQFKNKHKLNSLTKSSNRTQSKKASADESKTSPSPPANVVDSILSNTEKRPKSVIKRRLKKLIEAKKRSSENKNCMNLATGTGTGAQSSKHAKISKKETAAHSQIKDEASNNVQQISNAEQSIINNTSTSIAESNKREPRYKKTKKEPKKKELNDVNRSSAELETDKKITIKESQKPKSSIKNTSITSCPPSALAKRSMQLQQSKKIKSIVNQIASNLKQSGRFELNTGNIKREIYIKGLSTCRTSEALEQINGILNPPRMAAYKANLNANKNNTALAIAKLNQTQNMETPGEEATRPTTTPQDKNDLSKMSIANEINTFNKLAPPVPTFEHTHVTEHKTRYITHAQYKQRVAAEKVQPAPVAEEKPPINVTPPMTNQDQELIKKINEKIDQIINSSLNSCDTIDTSVSSAESKNPQQPLPPPPLSQPVAPVPKIVEPPRFMQAPNVSLKINTTITQCPVSAPVPTSVTTTTIKANHEPSANESPPLQPEPHIKKFIDVVRNSEIVNEIKQNTITVLQNVISKNAQQNPVEKINKVPEKIMEEEEKSKKTQNTTSKTVPSLKKFQISNEKIGQMIIAAKQHASLNNFRKPVKNIVTNNNNNNNNNNNLTSYTLSIGNRTNITSTHISKNNLFLNSATNNGSSSSSTLNLIANLSSSKKFSLLSPMEIVQDFVNLVNHAKRNRKTFTICGNFYSLRRAFAERGWIEKMRLNIIEDRETWRKIESLSNFELVDGMRNKEYGEKYRRVFLTKLLAGHQVDFYWDYLTNPFTVNNDKIKRTLINRFPYGATRAYTSKHGLTESLRDAHWYCIEGYANIFYPRTYNLSMIEEMTSFIEDFRITAVISLLQWILSNMMTPEKILSQSGDVPTSVYNFATIQCHNYIKMKENKDIDEVIPQAKDYEWEVFLEKYYKIVHNENCFKTNERISAQLMVEQSKYVLKKIKKYLPNLHLDGFKNMWLLKPNNGSRGCGIHVCRTLKYMMDTVNNRKDIKYVVQKYLERPLLIHKTKFDIRQWFLVTCMPNVKVWLYKECYLRFSSQMFDLNKLHESIHLTNNSIQCRYKNNNQRSTNLPEQNMWDSETFKKYLTEIGQPYAWRNYIYKGMKECLIALFMLCQSKMELRINSFELCGADFMVSEDYHPYLIEINSRPALYASTKITARMCPKVLEDVIKVTVDHARNPKASTGDFELIYTDSFNYAIPRNVNNLYIEGMSYFSKFIGNKSTIGLNTLVPNQPVKEVKTDSIKKILNIEPDVVKIDVRNTLEKILAVVHNDSNSKSEEKSEERNKKFRSMLSEFVNIISNVKNVNEEV